MKRLLHYIFIVALLSVVISCSNRHNDPRLTRIDAKIEKLYGFKIDTAKMMLDSLNAIDVTTLSPHNRAYHALLTSQAMYKAYITPTSDSIINVAYNYWTEHRYSDRLYMRALLYKANALEELQQLDSAMIYYKRVEQITEGGDPYYHGMALLRQGEIVSRTAVQPEVDKIIGKFEQARKDFESCDSTLYYQAIVDRACGYFYNRKNVDTAIIKLNRSIDIYKQLHDTTGLCRSYFYLATSYFESKQYRNAIDAVHRVAEMGQPLDRDRYYLLIRAHIRLGELDSAQIYIANCPKPVTPHERMFYFEYLRDLALAHGDSLLAEQYYKKSDHVTDSLYMATEHIYDSLGDSALKLENAAQRNSQLIKWVTIAVAAVVALLLVLAALAYLNRRRRKSLLSQLERLRQHSDAQIQRLTEALESHENNKTDGTADTKTLQTDLVTQQGRGDLVNDVINMLTFAGPKKSSIVSRSDIEINVDEEFWKKLYQFIDNVYPGARKAICSVDGVNEKDFKEICLEVLDLPLPVIAKMVDSLTPRSVSARRSLIRKKLDAVSLTGRQVLKKYSTK